MPLSATDAESETLDAIWGATSIENDLLGLGTIKRSTVNRRSGSAQPQQCRLSLFSSAGCNINDVDTHPVGEAPASRGARSDGPRRGGQGVEHPLELDRRQDGLGWGPTGALLSFQLFTGNGNAGEPNLDADQPHTFGRHDGHGRSTGRRCGIVQASSRIAVNE